MNMVVNKAVEWVEQGRLPDPAVRAGIRHLLRQRLEEMRSTDAAAADELAAAFIAQMRTSPVALVPEKANEQHYEVPAAFYDLVLGPHRKYSGCHWPAGVSGLEQAEAQALAVTCERAGLANGQAILELGCGWGSLTLWMAAHFPASRITAVSNSASQRAFIEQEAVRRGLSNVGVITCDMNAFDAGPDRFDRVVSVEMLEHMRNWELLFSRVAGWLQPGGRFFMHVFATRGAPYAFEERDASDWMSRFFFSGGMMPSDDLALHFQDDMRLLRRWRWDGTHYERTSNAWLANMDRQWPAVQPVLEQAYGAAQADLWRQRWRIFFMSVAELFGYDKGQQWWVSHYLFEKRAR